MFKNVLVIQFSVLCALSVPCSADTYHVYKIVEFAHFFHDDNVGGGLLPFRVRNFLAFPSTFFYIFTTLHL